MIEVEQRAFLAAAKLAATVIERRNTVPILDQLHCHANGALALSGTDLDMLVETRIDYQGKPLAPFMIGQVRHVLGAIGHAGGGGLALFPGENAALTVSAPDLSIGVKDCRDAGEWPMLGEMGAPLLAGTLGQREMALLRRVMRAMSSEETRYYLNGIFLHQTDAWTLRAVATDGHRLTVADLKLPDMAGDMTGIRGAGFAADGVIIPRKMVKLMLGQLGKADAVRIGIGRGVPPNADGNLAPDPRTAPRVEVTGLLGGMRVLMRSKTIDGTFPDYRRVIPWVNARRIGVKAAALRRVINTLAALSDSKLTPAVKLTVEGDALAVTAAYASADARMVIPCTQMGADTFSIRFNGRYLLDILADLPGEDVVFELDDATAPTIIRDPSESDVFSVLMPMRV